MYLMENFHKSEIASTGIRRELGCRGSTAYLLEVGRGDAEGANCCRRLSMIASRTPQELMIMSEAGRTGK